MQRFTSTVAASAGGSTFGKVYVVDTWANPCNIGIGLTGTNSAVYTVQHTFDDPFSADLNTIATWYNSTAASNLTGNQYVNYQFPPTGIRLALASAASAQATMTIIQAGHD